MQEQLPAYPPVPPDDLNRTLIVATPDKDKSLPHIGLVGTLDEGQQAEFIRKAKELAPKYRTELLKEA